MKELGLKFKGKGGFVFRVQDRKEGRVVIEMAKVLRE